MSSKRFLSIAKEIIRKAAELGLDEAGTRLCGSAWPSLKKVLSPVVEELERRFPKLLLVGDEEARNAAEDAVDALSEDVALQEMLQDGLSQLERGQEEILKVLAQHDDTLQSIGASIDRGFSEAAQKNEAALGQILQELQRLGLQFAPVPQLERPELSIDQIYRQANAYQQDAMKWISGRDPEIASQRLAQGRELLVAGLKREPNNAALLASRGYIEKSQAQVAHLQEDQDAAVTLLGEANKYFVKAWQYDQTNMSAVNGIANVYLYAQNYDRAIQLGKMIFEVAPTYGAAAFDLSMALEEKLKEVGSNCGLVKLLQVVYHHLEKLMPTQPQVFPANYLAYIQDRLAALNQVLGAMAEFHSLRESIERLNLKPGNDLDQIITWAWLAQQHRSRKHAEEIPPALGVSRTSMLYAVSESNHEIPRALMASGMNGPRFMSVIGLDDFKVTRWEASRDIAIDERLVKALERYKERLPNRPTVDSLALAYGIVTTRGGRFQEYFEQVGGNLDVAEEVLWDLLNHP